MTATTPTTKTVTRSPRKPADHAVSKSDSMQAAEQPPEGHDLLVPVSKLRSGAVADIQADLLELFEEMGVDINKAGEDDAEQEVDTSPATLRALGRMGSLLEANAEDVEGYIALDTGKGAQQRVLTLAMWYLGQLGESDSSAS